MTLRCDEATHGAQGNSSSNRMIPRTTRLLGLVATIASAAAFIGDTGSIGTQRSISPSGSTLCFRPSAPGNGSRTHHSPARLRAVPSRADEEPPQNDDKAKEEAATPSKYDDGDPRLALEQFGSLFTLLQEILLEGSAWDEETLEVKTQEFVRTYLRVFVPGIGYAFTSLFAFGTAFSSLLLALAVSGRGYADVLSAVDGVGPVRDLLEKADPAWGNAAIALLGCEVLSPVILAATLALTPRTMDALRGKLDEWGWGEDDIERRAADILRLTE